MPLRAVRSTSWAPLIWAAVPAWATCRVAASTWWTRSRSSTRSSSAASTASHGVGRSRPRPRRAPRVGEGVDLAAGLRGGGLDQALVLEQLQGGVDRAGARRPLAAAALRDHLDDLVAVHRLLGEQGEDRGAHVAAARAPARAEAGAAGAGRAAGAAAVAAAPRRRGRSSVMNSTLHPCGSAGSCRQWGLLSQSSVSLSFVSYHDIS